MNNNAYLFVKEENTFLENLTTSTTKLILECKVGEDVKLYDLTDKAEILPATGFTTRLYSNSFVSQITERFNLNKSSLAALIFLFVVEPKLFLHLAKLDVERVYLFEGNYSLEYVLDVMSKLTKEGKNLVNFVHIDVIKEEVVKYHYQNNMWTRYKKEGRVPRSNNFERVPPRRRTF